MKKMHFLSNPVKKSASLDDISLITINADLAQEDQFTHLT